MRCYSREWRKTENRRRWNSRKYPDGCTVCGTKDLKHQGKGLCSRCYSLQYAKEHKDRILELARGVYQRHREEYRAKDRAKYAADESYRRRRRETEFLRKYEGNGVRALEAAGYKCSECGYCKVPKVLQIHHKDRNRKHNALSNLEVLCPTCHAERHVGS